MNKITFTVADAIQIQNYRLLKWKSVLKPEKYDLLAQHAKAQNFGVTDPYAIFRGQKMDMYICNTLMD